MAGQGLDGEVDGEGKSCGTDAVTPSVNAEQHAVSSCLIDMPMLCSAIRDIVRAELDNFRQSLLTTLSARVSLNKPYRTRVVYGTIGKAYNSQALDAQKKIVTCSPTAPQTHQQVYGSVHN
jgi:hypothetical protein